MAGVTTGRGKHGIKRSLLTHDIRLVVETSDALQTERPGQKLRLCLDKGDEAGWLKTYLLSRRYEPHIQSRKEESDASNEGSSLGRREDA